MVNISSAILSAADRLEKAGIAQPRREAASLLQHSLGRNGAFLIAHPEYELTESECHKFDDAVSRRERREPFQLIVGRKEFYGLDFEVEAGVLIPRPETEILVEKAIELLETIERPTVFEVGVGTGCIAISILNSLPNVAVTAVDISDKALALAEQNARRHNVLDSLSLRKGDLFEGISEKFAMIVSNPPYISQDDAATLQPEVIDFDPPEALFSGRDGLDTITRMIQAAPRFIYPGGYLLFEFGYGQAERVQELLKKGAWTEVEIVNDLQGIPRALIAKRAI